MNHQAISVNFEVKVGLHLMRKNTWPLTLSSKNAEIYSFISKPFEKDNSLGVHLCALHTCYLDALLPYILTDCDPRWTKGELPPLSVVTVVKIQQWTVPIAGKHCSVKWRKHNQRFGLYCRGIEMYFNRWVFTLSALWEVHIKRICPRTDDNVSSTWRCP